MPATSVADTGAKQGDMVRCIKMLETGDPFRFSAGDVLQVHIEHGVAKVYGRKPTPQAASGSLWRGYGYEWELVKDRGVS